MQQQETNNNNNNSNRDPAIKLFGQNIPVLPAVDEASVSNQDSIDHHHEQEIEELQDHETDKDSLSIEVSEESADPAEYLQETNGNPKTPSIKEDNAKSKADGKEQDNSQDKTLLKKPDKILPCPRCNSMDTKFCYYNNYNVNQPRHFCKACQRYWTAGGTMRNVAVGAGRRKNKNSASHYRHITISEALQAARIEIPNRTHHTLNSNGRVLSFGIDAPICDSMASSLHLGDRNVCHNFEKQRIPIPCRGGEIGDDCSSSSTVSNLVEVEKGRTSTQAEAAMRNINGFQTPVPCLSGVPWPFPWNPTSAAFCPPPGYPMAFYPAPYWNCSVPGAMNLPWLSPESPSSTSSGPDSPTLGKHSRDMDTLKADASEKQQASKPKNGRVLVPKTLRIDDPNEAAKSSIWATLGIKNESLSGGGMFKAFQPKGEEKSRVAEASQALRANPAALSRSINFHENS
ncbi:hypothetical protein ACFE04_010158 [Oxalis oulophora]